MLILSFTCCLLVNVWLNSKCFIAKFPNQPIKSAFFFFLFFNFFPLRPTEINQAGAGCNWLCLSLSTNLLHNQQQFGRQSCWKQFQPHAACGAAVSRRWKSSSLSLHSHSITPVWTHGCGVCAGSWLLVPCSLVRSWLSLSGPQGRKERECRFRFRLRLERFRFKSIPFKLPLSPTLPAASAFFSWPPGETVQLSLITKDWCFWFLSVCSLGKGGGGGGVVCVLLVCFYLRAILKQTFQNCNLEKFDWLKLSFAVFLVADADGH